MDFWQLYDLYTPEVTKPLEGLLIQRILCHKEDFPHANAQLFKLWYKVTTYIDAQRGDAFPMRLYLCVSSVAHTTPHYLLILLDFDAILALRVTQGRR